MNDPHKFGTEFGSDNAPEHSAAIVSHHDSIKWPFGRAAPFWSFWTRTA
jgi:hypothetical protein